MERAGLFNMLSGKVHAVTYLAEGLWAVYISPAILRGARKNDICAEIHY